MDKKNNSEKIYSKSYYSYGSEAYKYYPEFEYGRRRRKDTRVERKKIRRKNIEERKVPQKARVRRKTHYEFIKSRKIDFKAYFAIGIFFSFVIVFICLFAVNTKKESEINGHLEELKKLEESNYMLKTEAAKNINLEEIEKIAKTRLNMQKPAPHQIVYINIPKQSYTIQYENSVDKKDDDFSLKNIFNNLAGD